MSLILEALAGPAVEAGREAAAEQRVRDAVAAFAQGQMVVVTDDDDRENEGDLFVAARSCTAEQMAFIIRHTSGIVCAPLPADHARRLHLDPMVTVNDAPLHTAFTVSVDLRRGLRTGISAGERAATVRALADQRSEAADFVRPGHVFPLVARDGGVLVRSGHTEACVDLCRLADVPPVGVLCELVNDDGTVMRGRQIVDFATRHRLRLLSVADLIAYRQARERLVAQVGAFAVETPHGVFRAYSYVTPFEPVQHLALVFGKIGDGRGVLTRLHRSNVVEDVFGERRQMDGHLKRLAAAGRGVLVYLRDGTAGVPAIGLDQGLDSVSEGARQQVWREVGVGAQILRDLGIQSIRLLSSSARSYAALSGFGVVIDTIEPLPTS